ncbi:hypothetical protein DL771_010413 [Monosporascus sp. 5C6A]|nr:hypothetical protein DL771_010413 [Monosporascus sp. 5C6A]
MVTPEQWIEWSTLIVTYTLVGMRVAVRLTIQQKPLLISDMLLLPAALCILGLDICDTITYRMGAMGNLGMISESLLKARLDCKMNGVKDANSRQVQFATSYLFDIGMYFPKLSMLSFYFHVIPLHDVLLRRALYTIAVVVTMSAVVSLTLRTFWCGGDPSSNCELLIFILPFSLLPQLRALARRERRGLVLIFTLGLITLMTSIGRFTIIMSGIFNVSVFTTAHGTKRNTSHYGTGTFASRDAAEAEAGLNYAPGEEVLAASSANRAV